MIDCITQYGEWRNGSDVIATIDKGFNDKTCFAVVLNNPNGDFLGNVRFIQFYDTKGKYTGFRLKSLK